MLALATMFHQLLTLTLTHNKLRLLATNRIDNFPTTVFLPMNSLSMPLLLTT